MKYFMLLVLLLTIVFVQEGVFGLERDLLVPEKDSSSGGGSKQSVVPVRSPCKFSGYLGTV